MTVADDRDAPGLPPDPDASASRQQEALAAIDHRLLAKLDAAGHVRANLIAPPAEMVRRPDIASRCEAFVPIVQAPVTREPPPDLAAALAEQVPQALLRDLHRAVLYFSRMLVRDDNLQALAGVDYAARVRAALAEARGLPGVGELCQVQLAQQELQAARATRRAPWAPLGKAEAS